MAEGEPLCKITKLDKCVVTKEQINDISSRLKIKTDYALAIEIFIAKAFPGFSFLKIIDSNADNSCLFSSALCKTKVNLCDENVNKDKKCYLPFKQLFNVELLNDVLLGRDVLEKHFRYKQFLALEKLADFLSTESEHADKLRTTSQAKYLKESDWAKVISAHLLSKLAVENYVTLDYGYVTSSSKHCPCNCGTELEFGDNSMGHEDVWHGSVDILVGRSVAVCTSVRGDEGSASDCSDCEAEMSDFESKVSKFDIDQVLSKCVVVSLTQTDRDLAPTVVITKNEMILYIYEKKHDILLESVPIRIFDGTSFDPVFVLSLWLTLNYRYFTDDTRFKELRPDDERFLFHAGFFEGVTESKQFIYQQCLRFSGCKHKRITEELQTNAKELRTKAEETRTNAYKIIMAQKLPISFAPVDDMLP